MDKSDTVMDVSTTQGLPVYRESRFRTPTGAERAIGLWVDRIGAGPGGSERPDRLRLLGQYAAVVVDAGEGFLRTPQIGTVPVAEGDVMVLTPQVPAAYGPNGTWYTRWIVWNGPEADSLAKLGYVTSADPIVHQGRRAGNNAYFSLVRTIDREDLGSVLQRKNTVLQLLLELYRTQRARRTSYAPSAVGEEVLSYLTANVGRDLSIAELAAEFHVSQSHFRRLFKNYTGRSPRQFITSLRVSRAKQLLSDGVTVKAAAAEVGYEDVFYFMRVFKRVTGTTPARFAAATRV